MKSVARVTEIIAASSKGFDDAIKNGVNRATKTLDNVTGAWVKDMKIDIENGKVKAYRVNLMITFILKD